jgi:adenine-specific DNA-methyltransferase
MGLTDYQAKYFAYELTRQAPADSMERLAATVAGAQVDLNPHQVDAALFAFKSPLSKGALLADEVGLGKTIEAGLVLAQKWAEHKRRLLVICPSSLRKQWHGELEEKFFLPSRILEKKTFDAVMESEFRNPFESTDSIVICSIEFAYRRANAIAAVPWDLVVIDEAHRLRNVWKPGNKIASAIHDATHSSRKLLLTATPLQNSLLELYGLSTFIDEHLFGDVESFKERYVGVNGSSELADLRTRIRPLVTRTLRRQVEGYISYTQRQSLVERFTPDEQEDILYEWVSEYLRRPNLQALPKSQRSLITMTLRKLLASSTFAIAGALTTMSDRLKRELQEQEDLPDLGDALADDVDSFNEESDEWSPDEPEPKTKPVRDVDLLRAEIEELDAFKELALSIDTNAKGRALLDVLKIAMDQVARNKAPRKAIVFTESRRTQDYLQRILADTEWKDRIVLFNGQNNDPKSREIYKAWMADERNAERLVDSPGSNMRAALVDYFRNEGQIMIATEAAAEGINLQFCALVVNYDLPWNPQRIEQRIGRCHRYGQKHDVVVVNFLNDKNEADQRVYELLREKFQLFDGVFGASDDPLGSLDSGVDFEKRILALYQNCRTSEEIEREYQQLRMDMAPQIDRQMQVTHQKLLDNFDDEVREKLRVQQRESKNALDRFEQMLMTLTRHELGDYAPYWSDDQNLFRLGSHPFGPDIPTGVYELPRRTDSAHIYRLEHPLAQHLVHRAKARELPFAELVFTPNGRVTVLEQYAGVGGLLAVDRVMVSALGQDEEYLVFAGVADNGDVLQEDALRRLIGFPATVTPAGEDLVSSRLRIEEPLEAVAVQRRHHLLENISTRNLQYFNQETEKLEGWADDLKDGLEREIKDLDRQIREAKREAKSALTLAAKLEGQKQVKALENTRKRKRQSLFEAQDEIDERRDALIAEIEAGLEQGTKVERLFTIRWRLA